MNNIDVFDLSGKTIAITGGGRGLGVTMTRVAVERGAKVAILGRRTGPLEEQAASLNEQYGPGSVLPLACDVADEDSVRSAADQLASEFGQLNGLINNAGITWGEAITSIDRSRWDKVLATNLTGTMLCSRHFLPLMERAGGGSVVAVSSATALRGVGFMNAASYTSSKAATEQFVREAAIAWAPLNVRVNTLRLGFFGSDMTEAFLAMGDNEQAVKAMAPLARVGRPEELTGAVQFLLSDASSYMTGSVLTLDGGALAQMGPRS